MATSRSGDVSFWTNSPGTQPVAVYHAAWPGVLVPLHAQVTPSRPAAIAMDAGAILGPPAGTSLVYGPVFEHWTAGLDSAFTESRRFYLQRSLVDLVEAHRHLPLTDTELLRWYLMQCPEDRRLIQDEGGFHQFLRRHPGLKLHQDQLSVKYPQGAPGSATPSMHQYAPPPRPRAADPPSDSESLCLPLRLNKAGPRTAPCVESLQVQKELETLPHSVRGSLALLGCCGPPKDQGGSLQASTTEEETSSPEFLTVMAEDDSILVCWPGGAPPDGGPPPPGLTPPPQGLTPPPPGLTRPPPASRHASVGTDPAAPIRTADAHVNTELLMEDMDYLTEQFIRLRRSCGLLEDGGRCRPPRGAEPANVSGPVAAALRRLDADFQRARRHLLAGGPGGGHPPAQAALEKLAAAQKQDGKRRRAVALVPRGSRPQPSQRRRDKPPICEDVCSSELWFDAEEDLNSAQDVTEPEAPPPQQECAQRVLG